MAISLPGFSRSGSSAAPSEGSAAWLPPESCPGGVMDFGCLPSEPYPGTGSGPDDIFAYLRMRSPSGGRRSIDAPDPDTVHMPPGVARPPARHRPRHRRRLGGQDRRPPLHRLPMPDPRRHRRPQTRPHPGRPCCLSLSLSMTHKAVGFDPPKPTSTTSTFPHRHPAGRRPRGHPPRRRQKPPGTPASHPPNPNLTRPDCRRR